MSRGKKPDGPIDDKRKPAALGAAVFGGLGTFAFLVVGTLLIGRVRFSDDLDQRATNLLAAVAKDAPSAKVPLGGAARKLRNEFDLRMPSSNHRPLVIGVVSTDTGSGATSMADALARIYAANNRKVLLIDTDLREQGLTRMYQLDQSPGVLEVVSGAIALAKTAQSLPSERGGLQLLPAGDVARVSTSAGYVSELAVDDMHRLLNLARCEHNVVVMDLGVLYAGRQSAVGAALVDRVLIVSASGETKRKLATALHLLDRLAPEKSLLVLNRATRWDPALATSTSAARSFDLKWHANSWIHKLFKTQTEA